MARPTAQHAWGAIARSLAAGDATEDAAHDDQPKIDRAPPPRPLFIAALIANGWFLRVKSFAYSPGVAPVPKRFKAAFSRWLLFLAAWITAIVFLPTAPVIFALVCWAAWIARDTRRTLGSLDVQQEISSARSEQIT